MILERKNDDTSIQPLDNDDLNEIKKIHEKKEMADLSSVVMLGCISAVLLSLILITVNSPAAEARCPDGYHMSPTGDCEQVSSGEAGNTNSRPVEDNQEEITSNERLSPSNGILLTQSGECRGEADCFRGKVTEIVDGDTIDVGNVRIRLSMVNTPERGEPGYNEATELTESVCPVGAKALVDEDDGQKEGSYDRLIGIVYCNGNATSLNQILLEERKAILYEDFCGVSEFARDKWVTSFGC